MHISWTFVKHIKQFTNAEIVKECMFQSVNVLFGNKKEIIKSFYHIPISKSIITRNITVMAKNNHELLKQDLSTADFYILDLDESCDITDTAQLIIHLKYLNNTSRTFNEELLTHLPLSGTTKGNDLYNGILMYFV